MFGFGAFVADLDYRSLARFAAIRDRCRVRN